MNHIDKSHANIIPANSRRERLFRPRKKSKIAPPTQMTNAIVSKIGNILT